ncbi:hypothetical protein RHMOL_Rhmol04G0195100 [Rhododendron molle]|uniref:Uncharacterized protein n=1 Tax=Rhododendron molle TaxID=49168 RepID=A0ACC0P4P0_RHOML|nr:hypothetical protein RHMOL_Rhmol04G0195100 [Rhododendron molle]
MAEINSGNSGGIGGDGGNGGNRPRDKVDFQRSQINDQTAEGASLSTGAAMQRDGDDDGGHVKEIGDGSNRRTLVPEGCTSVGFDAQGPWVQCLDSRDAVEGLVVIEGGFIGDGSSGSGSGGGGSDVQSGLPWRDSAKGKDPTVVEEASREVSTERPEFILVVGSSGHEPISKSDFADFMGDDVLAQLLAENQTVLAVVLVAREERLRQIKLAEEEEQSRREVDELVRETEWLRGPKRRRCGRRSLQWSWRGLDYRWLTPPLL